MKHSQAARITTYCQICTTVSISASERRKKQLEFPGDMGCLKVRLGSILATTHITIHHRLHNYNNNKIAF